MSAPLPVYKRKSFRGNQSKKSSIIQSKLLSDQNNEADCGDINIIVEHQELQNDSITSKKRNLNDDRSLGEELSSNDESSGELTTSLTVNDKLLKDKQSNQLSEEMDAFVPLNEAISQDEQQETVGTMRTLSVKVQLKRPPSQVTQTIQYQF